VLARPNAAAQARAVQAAAAARPPWPEASKALPVVSLQVPPPQWAAVARRGPAARPAQVAQAAQAAEAAEAAEAAQAAEAAEAAEAAQAAQAAEAAVPAAG